MLSMTFTVSKTSEESSSHRVVHIAQATLLWRAKNDSRRSRAAMLARAALHDRTHIRKIFTFQHSTLMLQGVAMAGTNEDEPNTWEEFWQGNWERVTLCSGCSAAKRWEEHGTCC